MRVHSRYLSARSSPHTDIMLANTVTSELASCLQCSRRTPRHRHGLQHSLHAHTHRLMQLNQAYLYVRKHLGNCRRRAHKHGLHRHVLHVCVETLQVCRCSHRSLFMNLPVNLQRKQTFGIVTVVRMYICVFVCVAFSLEVWGDFLVPVVIIISVYLDVSFCAFCKQGHLCLRVAVSGCVRCSGVPRPDAMYQCGDDL